MAAGGGFLTLLLVALVLGQPPKVKSEGVRLRLGYMPNLTHAPALVGVESGQFGSAVPGTTVQPRQFASGPAVIEALAVGELDVAYVGPVPAVNSHVRRGNLVVVAGCASGGASLVVRKGVTVQSVADLSGKTVAVPQIGNSQDVSLRATLASHGLKTQESGGAVTVLPVSNADVLASFRLGQLDAAWVPEPYATRLVVETGATRFLDERDLWPGRRFATTLLVARRDYAASHPETVAKVQSAHARAIQTCTDEPTVARALVQAHLTRLTGKPLPTGVLDQAWGRLDFTADTLADSVRTMAERAVQAGYMKAPGNWESGLYWRRP